ncbi:predicted protein [Naegleria gruberi]|uniref:Predicted protein n=1 Tax=Naegleria gruberi TaxID=5762 RepID=D2V8Q9_NAEGR|nr:uncharacterized protein NAEGRDRAFT_65245 [Naegleria gruberi]EFC46732.1 predicted protein [Naegleria gruberi]|eukprot:XP_002679476.1 predicted protein [Naegleria gruberi strain NEG-M]
MAQQEEGKRVLIFVRHGRSIFNELYKESESDCPASDPWVIDSELSERGFEQVRQFNQDLNKLLNCDGEKRIISSPLTRCIQTCFCVLESHQALPKGEEKIILDPDCTELEESSCDVGSTFEELSNGKLKDVLENNFDLKLIEGRGKWWYQNENNKDQTLHFEEWDVFMKRMDQFIDRLFNKYFEKVDTVIVFSHFTFIRECVNAIAKKYNKETALSIIGDQPQQTKSIPITDLENREVVVLHL